MTAYDDLKKFADQANQKLHDYENECLAVTREVLGEIRSQLGWPEAEFKRLQVKEDDVPADGEFAPGGWFDRTGVYRFFFRVSMGRHFINFGWGVCREDGSWLVRRGDASVKIDRADLASVAPLVKHIETSMREALEEQTFMKRWT